MNANELMIGDWVLSKSDDKIYKINSIITQGEGSILLSTEDGLHFDYMYEAIPITAEILEKNDFRHRRSEERGDFYTYTYTIEQNDKVLECEQHFNLSPDPYEGNGFHWIPEMSAVSALRVVYVHELQQLLRLCKIEKEIIL